MLPFPLCAARVLVHAVIVPDREIAGDIDAVRAGHAVAAARAAVEHALVQGVGHFLDCGFLLLGEGLEIHESLKVILELLG